MHARTLVLDMMPRTTPYRHNAIAPRDASSAAAWRDAGIAAVVAGGGLLKQPNVAHH